MVQADLRRLENRSGLAKEFLLFCRGSSRAAFARAFVSWFSAGLHGFFSAFNDFENDKVFSVRRIDIPQRSVAVDGLLFTDGAATRRLE